MDRSAVAPGTVRELRPREQVLSDLEDVVLQRGLRAGDPLPNEHTLAQSLRVSIFQVRDGVSALEALGVLHRKPDGTRVIGSRSSAARADLLRLRMSLTEFPTGNLVDVRIQLETCAVRRAASEAAPEHLARLRGLVDAMEDPSISREQFEDLDDRFHTGITEAADNALVSELVHALNDAFVAARTAAFATIADWATTRRRLVAEHRDILTALATGEGDRAAAHLRRHIADFYAAAQHRC